MIRRREGRPKSSGGMGRAVRYLTGYGREALLPYIFLIIATLSQLAIPRMIRNVIDAVTSGFIADQILAGLEKIPAGTISTSLPQLLEVLAYPADWSAEQLAVQLEANIAAAPVALITALVAIVIFAICKPTGPRRIRSPWPMIYATTYMPKSSGCPSHITIRIRLAN